MRLEASRSIRVTKLPTPKGFATARRWTVVSDIWEEVDGVAERGSNGPDSDRVKWIAITTTMIVDAFEDERRMTKAFTEMAYFGLEFRIVCDVHLDVIGIDIGWGEEGRNDVFDAVP